MKLFLNKKKYPISTGQEHMIRKNTEKLQQYLDDVDINRTGIVIGTSPSTVDEAANGMF